MRIKIPESERLAISGKRYTDMAVLKLLRRLDELARENPELYQRAMFEQDRADTVLCSVEQKERCRCDQ